MQAELVRRRVVHTSPSGKKRIFSCNHCFAQIVFCGELYRRVHWNNQSCKSIVWRCISHLEPTSVEVPCENRTVNELLLQEDIAKAVVSAAILSPDGIQARLVELQQELIKKSNSKQDYDAIADEIFRLREQKEKFEVDSYSREEALNRIKELQDFISQRITVFTGYFVGEFKSGISMEITK